MKFLDNQRLKKSFRLKLLILFVTSLSIMFMFPQGESLESEVMVGSIWIQDDLIASQSFPVLKSSEEYRIELENAKRQVYKIFLRTPEIVDLSLDSLRAYNTYLTQIIDENLNQDADLYDAPTFLSEASYRIFKTKRMLENQMAQSGERTLSWYFGLAERSLSEVYDLGVLSLSYEQISKDSIALRNGNIDVILPKTNFYDFESARNALEDVFESTGLTNQELNALYEYATHFLMANYIYSASLTREEIEDAQSKVSRFSDIVTKNERIVEKHERITPEIKRRIDSYKASRGEVMSWEGLLLQYIGKYLHVLSLLSLLTIYIYMFRKHIYNNNSKLLIFAVLFIGISYMTFLVTENISGDAGYFLVVIPAASMLLTILFDSRVGFYSTIILALICGGLRGNDYIFTAINIFAGSLSVYTVRDIKNRTQIFRSLLFILLGYVTMILTFGFERFAPWSDMLVELGFAGINSLISPVLTYGLLIFFERSFRITTDLTLLELSNFDRPLLRELARKSPGTFSHSVTMGTLAESAAEAIGANPLLARVGAYYHDVGKTLSPQFFVENQLDNKNPHNELTPEESVQILLEHVKGGMELAKNHKIPQEIIDFIPSHHGTSIIVFFYEKAKEKYGEDKVDVKNYRYPGPKPQTKETAILMLADSCESAVRSVDDPDADKIANLIEKLIDKRIDDGQLSETPLTFGDITKIKKTFVNILLGQQHRRIRYPNQEEMEKEDGKER